MSEGEERQRVITIALHNTISYKGSTLSEITVNPPTMGAMRQAQGHQRNGITTESNTKMGVALVARCAGIDDAAVEQMEADDFADALEHVYSFLGGKKTSGNTSE